MKTKNYFTMTTLVALSFAVLISCQKKSDSNNGYVAPAPIIQPGILGGNCAGCNFPQVQLGQATSTGSSMSVNWQLVADQNIAQQVVNSGLSVKMYSGPIAVRGVMNVTSAILFGGGYGGGYGGYGCQMPVGQYQINTLQVGAMQTGSFVVPQFEAISGATRIIFRLANGTVLDPMSTGTITGVYAELIPVAAIINGAQVACSDVGIAVGSY